MHIKVLAKYDFCFSRVLNLKQLRQHSFYCSGLRISLFKFSFLHAFVLRGKHCRWIFRDNGVSIDRSADHIFFSINDFSLAFFGFLLFNEADRRYQLPLMISHSLERLHIIFFYQTNTVVFDFKFFRTLFDYTINTTFRFELTFLTHLYDVVVRFRIRIMDKR